MRFGAWQRRFPQSIQIRSTIGLPTSSESHKGVGAATRGDPRKSCELYLTVSDGVDKGMLVDATSSGAPKGGPLVFHLTQFTDVGLLLLRLMVGLVFFTSGWNTLKDPDARSKNIEMNKPFTIFLGTAESLGALGLIVGILTQLAGIGLMLISLGAIWKKIAAWHTGFWGENAAGWHYDLMLILMTVVIVAADGGRYVLMA